MSGRAAQVRRDALRRIRERDTEAVALLAAAEAQWWRLAANWKRRRAARALCAENRRDLAIIAAAWEIMTPSERAAANAGVTRRAAVQRPPGAHDGAGGS